MPTPIKGIKGVVLVNPGTINEYKATWAGEWEVTIKNDTQDFGPHFGDANIYSVETSRSYEWSVKGTIPEKGDIAVRAMRDRASGRTSTFELFLGTFGGDAYRFASSTLVFEEFKSTMKADGTHEFEAKGKGVATVFDLPVDV